ncbi:hypothetical protein HYV91_00505 [Candidatus Wolfebacteria bacterium]|nr:hypothetical protein [Candidatus Wolfebacteria bacterium]
MRKKIFLRFFLGTVFAALFFMSWAGQAEAKELSATINLPGVGEATVYPNGQYTYTDVNGNKGGGQASLSDLANFVASLAGAEVKINATYDNGSTGSLGTTMQAGAAEQNLAQMNTQGAIVGNARNADELVDQARRCNCITGGEGVSDGTTVSASGQGNSGGVNFTLSVQGVSQAALPEITPSTPQQRPGGPTITNFQATPNSVGANGSVALTWASNGESANISFTSTGGVGIRYASAPGLPGVHYNNQPTSGSITVTLTNSLNSAGAVTFILEVLKAGQTARSTQIVSVGSGAIPVSYVITASAPTPTPPSPSPQPLGMADVWLIGHASSFNNGERFGTQPNCNPPGYTDYHLKTSGFGGWDLAGDRRDDFGGCIKNQTDNNNDGIADQDGVVDITATLGGACPDGFTPHPLRESLRDPLITCVRYGRVGVLSEHWIQLVGGAKRYTDSCEPGFTRKPIGTQNDGDGNQIPIAVCVYYPTPPTPPPPPPQISCGSSGVRVASVGCGATPVSWQDTNSQCSIYNYSIQNPASLNSGSYNVADGTQILINRLESQGGRISFSRIGNACGPRAPDAHVILRTAEENTGAIISRARAYQGNPPAASDRTAWNNIVTNNDGYYDFNGPVSQTTPVDRLGFVADNYLPSETKSFTISSGQTYDTTFYLRKLTYRLDVNKTGPGTVTSDPAGISLNCETACNTSRDYEQGTNVTLRRSALSQGITFHWEGACSGGAETCTLLMDAQKTVTAVFETPRVQTRSTNFTLRVRKTGTGIGAVQSSNIGGINCDSDCRPPNGVSIDYPQGTRVRLTATPGTASNFASWSGDCSGGTCELEMGSNKTVTATFNRPTSDSGGPSVPGCTGPRCSENRGESPPPPPSGGSPLEAPGGGGTAPEAPAGFIPSPSFDIREIAPRFFR